MKTRYAELLCVSITIVVGCYALPADAAAQESSEGSEWKITSAVVVGTADHRVDAGGGIERTSGPIFGIEVDGSRTPTLALSVRAIGGALDTRSRAASQRDVGEVGADVRMRILSWLDARGGMTARGFTSSLARQRWTQLSIGADSRVLILGGAIEGTAGAALLPYVRVSGHESPRIAGAASMGLRHESARFEVGLSYQLERYDFAQVGTVTRAEEHSTLLLRAGYRFGVRRIGR